MNPALKTRKEETMNRLLHHGAIAVMALALPLATLAQNNLNLDTGATGSSGGDIAFNGTTVAPVGAAQLADLSTAFSSEFNIIASSGFLATLLQEQDYSTTPIDSSSLVVGEVFAVHTNGGNYAGVMVTAASSGSITIEYLTYTASGTKIQGATVSLGGPGVPTVTKLVNNYANIDPAAPNYGISPGSLLVIKGFNLSAAGSPLVLQDPSKALPNTLYGATVSVTVGGTTVQPAFYYAFPTQLAVVLPSSTPVGTGTLTVTYSNQTSAPVPLTVVSSAFGLDTYGGGLAAVTDNLDGHLITASNSAKPGETVLFWGSGVGANKKDTDVSPPTNFDDLSGITAFYLGGAQVPVIYQGRSSYQGVDQVAITIPSNAPTGCAVSVVAVSGSLVSNFATIPVASGGGTCVDPLSYYSPSQGSTLSGKTTVRFGGVLIIQSTQPTAEIDNEAVASFASLSGSQLTGYQSSSRPSLGSCFVTQTNSSTATSPFTLTGLDAGALSVQGPVGTDAMPSVATGTYLAQLPTSFIPAAGGAFVFTGTGGADVGPFTATVNFNTPLVWTNPTSDAAITRASGVTVTWNGGLSGTFAVISGASSANGFSGSFVCDAPISAHTFTVPTPVLLSLPAGTGNLEVSNYTNPASFTVPSLDYAYAMGFASTSIDATYH
jgi:uncharacterized protein (TIGR03437 family)